MKKVVITGLGAVTPIGNNVSEYWDSLINGRSGAAEITRFDASKFKTRFACELKNFDPLEYIKKPEIRKYDPFIIYALAAAQQALDMSGAESIANKHDIGVIWGTGNGGFATFEEQVTEYVEGDGTPRFNPYFIPKTIPNMASGIIAIKHGLTGINFTAVSACAAANTAIMDAFNYIRWGKAKMIVTGGSEAGITPATMGGFSAMKALSTNNDNPAGACRPFDAQRDGFVMGEGAGALVLEEYEHAVARGANIIAEVAGAAMTADAYHISATHPEGEGAARAIELALQDANLTAADMGYINCHATSTPVGDLSETNAIAKVFAKHLDKIKISATKSMTGHLLGGAGAIEAIASILAVKNNIIPPTINTSELDEKIPEGLNIVIGKAVEHKVNVAMSNAFGFGGHNAIVIFKKH
ncbi:beta-ketoacyl-ACP synthase II [Cytophagaceae bacterium ABcell3]|nr:beta-ketoacyl-ACP synthase II [Cytophagaceae bacterium ABcell3]